MEKTFDTVDLKIAETEFFLRQLALVYTEFDLFRWYFSAFLSASRAVTLALQQFKELTGFDEWYAPHQRRLKENDLARFFLKQRNDHVHGGQYPVGYASFYDGVAEYYFDKDCFAGDNQIKVKVVDAARDYFADLLRIVYDCYVTLGMQIDPQQYYTKENYAKLGKTINQAECELWGWIRTSLIDEGYTEDDRWHELRGHVDECKINHLFYSYLGKITLHPLEPEHYKDFAFTPEDSGWIHVPAGFKSLEEYWSNMDITSPGL